MGESPPFDDFSWTDGICAMCKDEEKGRRTIRLDSIAEKRAFFRGLRDQAIEGEDLNHLTVLKRADQLGLKTTDVLVGILQPILTEIGCLFEQGKISTVEEHRFSVLSDRILCEFENRIQPAEGTAQLDVLLANADGNYHTIGMRILALFLREAGLTVRTVYPSVPDADLVKICLKLRPTALGISIFSPEQMDYVKNVLSALAHEKPAFVAVGGNASKNLLDPIENQVFIAPPRELIITIEKFVAACRTARDSRATVN